jgi:hypothetical protein
MSWVNVISIRHQWGRSGRITVGIIKATGGALRISFCFSKVAALMMGLSPGRCDMDVGDGEHAGFVRIHFGRPSGGLRVINSSGHPGAGLRVSSAVWDGIDTSAPRLPITQAYWNADSRCLAFALPSAFTGKETAYRNDLGAVLNLG